MGRYYLCRQPRQKCHQRLRGGTVAGPGFDKDAAGSAAGKPAGPSPAISNVQAAAIFDLLPGDRFPLGSLTSA
jgi:hypothetical protein